MNNETKSELTSRMVRILSGIVCGGRARARNQGTAPVADRLGAGAVPDFGWLFDDPGADGFGPDRLAEAFAACGRAVRHLAAAVPPARLAARDGLGLSPLWVIGHQALLARNVLEGLGGVPAGEPPAGLYAAVRTGGDGSEVRDPPAVVLRQFDRELAALAEFLAAADPDLLARPWGHDPFGLCGLAADDPGVTPGLAAVRYAGMCVMELAILLDKSP